jgi:zinc protease
MRRIFFLCAAGISTALSSALAIGGVDSAPGPSASHEIKFPAPKETKLENGLRVIVVERPELPLLAVELLVRSGAEVDPDNLAGAASLTASLLTKGTEKMSAPQIATAIESLGASISSGAQWDASRASISVMSAKAEAALSILADVVRHPTFHQDEIDRLKSQTLDGVRVALQQPGSLGRFVTQRVIFGAGEYGHAEEGTLESLAAIQREDIVQLYKTHYTPANAVLILAGDVTLEKGRAYAQQFFGDWQREQPSPNESKRAEVSTWKAANVVIDMPEAGQAAVTVARPAIQRDSPDYYAALVANAALGNGFISRLNREIRIKRGLSYGAHSSIDPRRGVGPFTASAQTKNESAAEVASLLESELKRLGQDPVEGEELKSRQAVLTGGYARGLETNQGFVEHVSALAIYALPLDRLDKFIPAINAVTPQEVSAFAEKYFAAPPSLVIVGKAAEFLKPLQKKFQDVKVIAQSDLDLNRPELVKAKE